MGYLTDSFKNMLGIDTHQWTRVLDGFKLNYPNVEVRTHHLGGRVPYTYIVWRTPNGKYIVDLYPVTENELNFPRDSSGAFIFPKSLKEISNRTDDVPMYWNRFSYDRVVGEIGYLGGPFSGRIFTEDLGKVLGKKRADEERRSREYWRRVDEYNSTKLT